ncbi:hypothetical protein KC845_01330 [Candidatus Kaiserbacteria bacterium]|nr:hypothetical protein [Candidatus Kaiserbacteria bacterium]
MRSFIILNKEVGQTPLDVVVGYKNSHPKYQSVPMAYAGRLDPMASGKLLILIGKECKQQEKYHKLDKEYRFEVLLGVSSDTADVLGIINNNETPLYQAKEISEVLKKLTGNITLPYPHYSSKTVAGKPLHTWTLEGRLSEIIIPTRKSTIYKLKLNNLTTKSKDEIIETATTKIETIPKVTDERKALGADFRRVDVRQSWQSFKEKPSQSKYQIATFTCIASSGTYMRTLAEVIAKELDTTGLAFSIHREKIGQYQKLPFGFGYWKKQYK